MTIPYLGTGHLLSPRQKPRWNEAGAPWREYMGGPTGNRRGRPSTPYHANGRCRTPAPASRGLSSPWRPCPPVVGGGHSEPVSDQSVVRACMTPSSSKRRAAFRNGLSHDALANDEIFDMSKGWIRGSTAQSSQRGRPQSPGFSDSVSTVSWRTPSRGSHNPSYSI